MPTERTLVLVKPDGVQRGLIGPIVSRLELTGLKIIGLKIVQITDEMAAEHYAEHSERPFYAGLVAFITSGPVVAMAVSGPNAVAHVRRLMGATNPQDAAPGTIRGDLATDIGRNVVHGSANIEDGERELPIFFEESEIISYHRANGPWIIEP
jgi:nucleoside-diphosphate kinase